MALTDAVAVARTTIKSQKWNNVPYLLGGAEGFGDFVALTQYNSDTTPALRVKNLNSAGTHLDVLGSDGNPRLRVTDDTIAITKPIQGAASGSIISDAGNIPSVIHDKWDAGTRIKITEAITAVDHEPTFTLVATDAGAFTGANGGNGLLSTFSVQTQFKAVNSNPAANYAAVFSAFSNAVREYPFDMVALASIATTGEVGVPSNAQARGFYSEANLFSTHANATAVSQEVTVRNGLTTDAPDFATASGLVGCTVGIALESGLLSSGHYNTVGMWIHGDIASQNSAWRRGIIFNRNSVLECGLDFGYLTGGTMPTSVMRIPNTGMIKFMDSGGGDINGISVPADNRLKFYNSTGLQYVSNDGSTTYLNASPPTLTWNGTGAAGSMSALTVANADNTAAASAARIRVSVGGATSTSDPWVSFLVTNTTEYVMGIDNSVTTPVADPFMICVGAAVGSGQAITVDTGGNVVIGSAALATNATSGFLYVPSGAGAPSGTPTTYTGRVPMYVDTTNSFLYFYIGGSWKKSTVYA